QRVAIARALIKNPEIIMADEPTGALDSATGKQVMDTLKKLSKTKLVIIVSHDREFAEIYGDRVIELKDGKIIKDETKTEVEALKSESGVSFIDNKIIHIKKGQQITKEDLVKINQMIVHNLNNEDTIISFDTKSNNDVKKSAFITDDGNREVFKTTSREDIKRANHNPDDFKMIKSKLRFKDSFKMGASSLKHKPIRLIFTILLSVFAFGMFGVVNTMSSFNRADSMYATTQQLGTKTIAINKRINYYDYSDYLISDDLFNKFQTDNPSYKFYKVIASNENYNVYASGNTNNGGEIYSTIYRSLISGVTAIDDNIMTELDLTLLEGGRLPETSTEICISNNMLNTIIKYYSSISSFADLNNKQINIGGFNSQFTIVGVIKDNTDISKYANLDGTSSSRDENNSLYQELDRVMKFGLINMCYVSQNAFSDYLQSYKSNNSSSAAFSPYIKGGDNDIGGSSARFEKATTLSNVTYFKNNTPLTSLTNNQAIISKNLLMNNLSIPADKIEERINNGLIVPIGAGYQYEAHKNHMFDLEIVGYYDSYSDMISVNSELYNKHFAGCSYMITQLKNSTSDKALIKYFENHPDKPFMYSVQFVATPVLDDFGGMIEDMAKILLWIGVGLAAFSGLMLMNFISVSITYKKREIGVLRAIGARSKDVFSIFFAESFVICMINFLLSSTATGIICTIINNTFVSKLGVSLTLMMFGMPQIILLFAVSIGVAFISTFLPVYKFAKKNPIDSINNR
ncbi:MAG: FtsX-like permease family protein, partial [Clostridia bacterium]|nr:FtsX-like permease family protein [Clostridia bacterium]